MARLTEAQRLARKDYMGATDIAVAAGVSPYQTPFELYLEKIGELDTDARRSDKAKESMERGHRLEDVALDWYADDAGITIERVRRDIRHPKLPFIVVHPDARVKPWRVSRRLLEAKTAYRMPADLPQHWEAQAQAQMAATGADQVDIVVLTFDGAPQVIPVPRNDDIVAALEAVAIAFWRRVADREPPPVDGSRGASRWVNRLFRDGPEIRADDEQAAAIRRYLDTVDAIDRLEAERDTIKETLKFSMTGSSRLYAPGIGKAVMSAAYDKRTTAWKEVSKAYRELLEAALSDGVPVRDGKGTTYAVADLDALVSLHTSVEEGVRQFRITSSEEQA